MRFAVFLGLLCSTKTRTTVDRFLSFVGTVMRPQKGNSARLLFGLCVALVIRRNSARLSLRLASPFGRSIPAVGGMLMLLQGPALYRRPTMTGTQRTWPRPTRSTMAGRDTNWVRGPAASGLQCPCGLSAKFAPFRMGADCARLGAGTLKTVPPARILPR